MADVVEMVKTIAMQALMWVLGIIAVLGSIAGAWFWTGKIRKYNIPVVIFERDGFGNVFKTTEKAGIFVDSKTNNKRFFLKKNNVGLNADSVPFIPDEKGKRCVYLAKTGLKNFQFLHMNVSHGANFSITVGEEDVNWAINAYERQKKAMLNNKWKEFLPWIGLAFVGIVFLVLMIYTIQRLDVLKDLGKSMADLAVTNREMAQTIAAAKSGTTVIH